MYRNGGITMVCSKCNFDNKEGAAFCAQCGAPLAAPAPVEADEKTEMIEEAAPSNAPVEADDFDERTTVLTSNSALDDMPGVKAPEAAPMSAAPQPAPMPQMAPQGAPMGQPMPPQGMPAPMPAPMQVGQAPMGPNGKPAKAPKAPKAPKEAKAPKAPKAPKDKQPGAMKTGVKVYIIISIVLILALIGVGVWGFLTFNKKVDDRDKEIANLKIDVEELNSEIADNEEKIDDQKTEIEDLNDQITDLNDLCTSYEETISAYEESNSEYAAYDALINFSNGSTGQGYTDFFVSDTVVHLVGGEVAVKLYFAHEGDVMFTCADSSVVSCAWSDSFENNVASLYLTPVGSGNTTVTISNSVNDEEITIFVYVD